MKRALALAYGVAAYASFLGIFAGLVDFLTNAGFLRGIDVGPTVPWPRALAADLGLVALFGASHSLMARPAFKERWTRLIPPVAERSTYVLVASIVLAGIVWLWRSMPALLWNVELPAARIAIWGAFAAGLGVVIVSTFLTSHFDLVGLRQMWLYARGRPYTPVPFQVHSFYRYVRHPLMVGFFIVIWATPSMSVGHLLFAIAMSAYIAIGVALEERDLEGRLGEPYREYRRNVRAFLPFRR